MVINSNLSASQSARWLRTSFSSLTRSLGRLASGSKITSPEDDAGGLAQSIKLNNESLRHRAAMANLENAISFLQTKDGSFQKVQKALDRMSELSLLALDTTKTDSDRQNYDLEFQTLRAFLGDTSQQRFNGIRLFSGYQIVNTGGLSGWNEAKAAAEALGGHLATITSPAETEAIAAQLGSLSTNVWIGATDEVSEGDFQWVSGEAFGYTNWFPGEPNGGGAENYVHLVDGTPFQWNDSVEFNPGITAFMVEVGGSLSVTTDGNGSTINLVADPVPNFLGFVDTLENAAFSLERAKNAIDDLAARRANTGAFIQRLQAELDTLNIRTENLDSSVSRIRDVNVARETSEFARSNILVQSGTAMLAQANLLPQSVLRLLA